MSQPSSSSFWKAVVFVGTSLVLTGLCAIGLDFVTMGAFDFDRYYGYIFLAILAGLLCLIVGLVAWAIQLDKRRKVSVGTTVFAVAVLVCLAGSLIGGTNAHGPFYLFVLPMIPLALVGLFILLMGVASRTQ